LKKYFKMTVKLNLTIDETLVSKIKVYAAQKQTSVSKLVESLLREEIETVSNESNISKKFAGILSGKILDEEKIKEDHLMSKYG
jgi:metal-responsive CopG/Arc/MetJ family transcriptional regulator